MDDDVKRIVVIGPPGSGKGTLARLLATRFEVSHVSVGALLRGEIAARSVLGDRVAAAVAAGDLVAIDDVAAVLREPLEASIRTGGWILDGAPRTVTQAAGLAEMIEGSEPSRAIVLALVVPEEELRARLLHRSRVEDRVDDDPPVISHRLAVWAQDGPPLLDWYARRGILARVDGTGDPEMVASRAAAAVDRALHPGHGG